MSGKRPDSLNLYTPGLSVRCSILSIEIMCENRLELGHHDTIADVCDRFSTLRFDGANDRSLKNKFKFIKKNLIKVKLV